MDDSYKPTAFEDLGPTQRLTSTDRASPASQPSNATKTLVGELGLRYRPSAQADLEAHAAKLALLVRDMATMPPHLLRQAVDRWVVQSEFMPTAAELIRLCRQIAEADPRKAARDSHSNAQLLANRYNATMSDEHAKVMHWVVTTNNELRLEPIEPSRPPASVPLSRSEIAKLPAHLVSLGLANGFLEHRDGQLVERYVE